MSRVDEALEVQVADKAAAVGRLMLGQLSSLEEFLDVGARDYHGLPRRSLRSGRGDVRKRLFESLDRFCRSNFEAMTPAKLAALYDEILPKIRRYGGAAIPLPVFSESFSPILPKALKGAPAYATVVLSVRGLQFEFPEDQIAKDILSTLAMLNEAVAAHPYPKSQERLAARQMHFAARACVLSAFNLVEAYLNGLLWSARDRHLIDMTTLSSKQRRVMDNKGTLRDKLLLLPAMLSGRHFDASPAVTRLIDKAKPFRDSLTHPSPISAPEEHGGYDKLSYFHAVDPRLATLVAVDAIDSLHAVMVHAQLAEPPWLTELREEVEKTAQLFGIPKEKSLQQQRGGAG